MIALLGDLTEVEFNCDVVLDSSREMAWKFGTQYYSYYTRDYTLRSVSNMDDLARCGSLSCVTQCMDTSSSRDGNPSEVWGRWSESNVSTDFE